MFFIFSFDMLIWVLGIVILFFLFLLFPVPMLIVTGIIIWIVFKAVKVRSEVE